MRLIDADELTELLNWTFAKPPFSRKTVQKIIDMARTIDAVPVIRCKDCIRWRQSKSDTTAKVCDWDRYEKTENDFCSWAKRREDG